jgi:adenylate kinase family enzyme
MGNMQELKKYGEGVNRKMQQSQELETIKYEEESPNADILIRLSVLLKGPLLERRKEIRKSFVLASLSTFKAESEFEIKDLSKSIKNITKCEIENEILIDILNQLESEAIIQHIDGLKYKLNQKIALPDFGDLTKSVWEEFVIYLKEQYKDYDPYIDRGAKEIFDLTLLKFLRRITISSNYLVNQIESLPIDNFKLVIEECISKSFISKNLSKRYSEIVYSFLGLKSPHLSKFIFDNYSKLINLDLLMREQEMPTINFLENIRFLLIDTSFLAALMCRTDPLYPLASAVAKQCSNSNIPLYFAPRTKQEIWRVINGSKHEMDSLYQSKMYGIIKSQFVSDFRRQNNISWHEYISILDLWEKMILNQWRIKPIPADFDETIDEEVFQYVRTTLPILDNFRNEGRARSDPNYQPRHRGDLQFDHDAFCLGLIANNRKLLEEKNGKKPIGPWFLTFDNLLSVLNAAYFRKDSDLGLIIQPRTMLNYLVIYSKIQFKKEDTESVAEAILKFTARIPDPRLSFDEYTRLVTYKIGLDEADIEVIREIFLASPLRAELERAVELEHGKEADNVVYTIITNQPFVETILNERKTNEKFKNMAREYHKIKEELIKKNAALEILERIERPNIIVTTNVITNIDVKIQNQVKTLISLLEAENAFKDGLLLEPQDISNIEKLKKWLDNTKNIIETSKTVSDGIRALLPFVTHLIMNCKV